MPERINALDGPGGSVETELQRLYSGTVIDHLLNPRNVGQFEKPDGWARLTSPCGDRIQICLRVKDDRISDARFMSDGCAATIACASAATEMARGRRVSEALLVTQDDIIERLDGLPESEVHCSVLAASTLRAAAKDYLALRREPWKKPYRRIEPL